MTTIINKYNDHSEIRFYLSFTLFTHFQKLFTNSQNGHKQIYIQEFIGKMFYFGYKVKNVCLKLNKL